MKDGTVYQQVEHLSLIVIFGSIKYLKMSVTSLLAFKSLKDMF